MKRARYAALALVLSVAMSGPGVAAQADDAAVYDTITIRGTIWDDVDVNQVLDEGETVMPGIELALSQSGYVDGAAPTGPVMNPLNPDDEWRVVTDAEGNYEFSGVPYGELDPGEWLSFSVSFELPGEGWFEVQTRYDVSPVTIELPSHQDGVTTRNIPLSNYDADDPSHGTVTLNGHVWEDLNADGIKDPGEEGIPDISLQAANLAEARGQIKGPSPKRATTDAEGYYELTVPAMPENDDPELYTWRVSTSNLPLGWIPAQDQPYSEASYGVVITVTGEDDHSVVGSSETIDFPVRKKEADENYVISEGHADVIFPELLENESGAQELALRARADAFGVIDHEDLVIHVSEKLTFPALEEQAIDHSAVAPAGTTVWNAGFSSGSKPWIGLSTESPTLKSLEFRHPFSFTLDAVTGIDGGAAPGDVVMWQDISEHLLGAPMWSSRPGGATADSRGRGVHSHYNWSFTESGVYCLAYTVQTEIDGVKHSDSKQLTLAVGDEIDPYSVTQCEGNNPYPTVANERNYVEFEASAPNVITTSGAVHHAIDLDEGALTADLAYLDPSNEGRYARMDQNDAILYTPLNAANQNDTYPYRAAIPRWDTTLLGIDEVQGNVTFEATEVRGPGELTVPGTSQFPQEQINTAEGQNELTVWPSSIHSGGVGATVSRPGKYCIATEWSATTASGEQVSDTGWLTLVADGPLDPNGYAYDEGTWTATGDVWVGAEEGALETTCEQDPDSWTRASEVPAPGTDPGEPETPVGEVPNWSETVSGAKILNDGHVDVASVLTDGVLDTKIKDTTAEAYEHIPDDDTAVWHEPEDVVFQLLPEARRSITENSNLDFLGEVGDDYWSVLSVQEEGLLWPGWSTETIPAEGAPEGVEWKLTAASGPGDFALYTPGGWDGLDHQVHFNTVDGIDDADSFVMAPQSHVHGTWSFTEEGAYCLAFERTATLDGEAQSDAFTLAVAVGETDPTVIDPANCETGEPVVAVPDAPEKPSAVPNGDAVTVSWEAPRDGGSPITGYTVQLLGGSAPLVQDVAAGTTSATFSGLPAGTYRATVVAVNAAGASAASPESKTVTVAPTPDPEPTSDPGGDLTLPGTGAPPVVDSKLTDASLGSDGERLASTGTDGELLFPLIAGAGILLLTGAVAVVGAVKRRRSAADDPASS